MNSAGVGRSGTFIAIDIILKRLREIVLSRDYSALTHALNIRAIVEDLRKDRMSMVQTWKQYQMLYNYIYTLVSPAYKRV
jgi:protein-tyrosine phosphatase